VLHSAEEYADYLALFDDPARFDALAARENFGAVVLTTAYPDRSLGLIWHLANSTNWRLAYTDGYEVLLLRDGPALALGERQPSTPSWKNLRRASAATRSCTRRRGCTWRAC